MKDETMQVQPLGQSVEDAPIQAELQEEESVSRRAFMKVALGSMCAVYGAAIGYPVYRYLNSPVEQSVAASAVKEVVLKDADKLPKGSAMIFKFGTFPALLIHHEDDHWTALNAVCTHLGCTVQYEASSKKVICACHGGEYDAKTGANTGGPPPRPLDSYNVEVTPGQVVVKRA